MAVGLQPIARKGETRQRNTPTVTVTERNTTPKRKNMNKNNSIVAIYPSHTAAEAAVKELQQAGFDMKKLSIGGDYRAKENIVGRYNAGDRVRYWGRLVTFWCGFFGISV